MVQIEILIISEHVAYSEFTFPNDATNTNKHVSASSFPKVSVSFLSRAEIDDYWYIN